MKKDTKFHMRLSKIAEKYEVETELQGNNAEANQVVNQQEIEYVNGPKKVIIRSERKTNVWDVDYEGSSSSCPLTTLIIAGIVIALGVSTFQNNSNAVTNNTQTNYTSENKSNKSDVEKLKKQSFDAKKLKYMDDKEFIETIAPYAIVLGNNNNIYPSTFLIQIIWESGWGNRNGKNPTVDYNNFFGIKSDKSWKGKRKTIRTENDNQPYGEFRWYETPYDSLEDYVKFLNENSRYEKAIKCYKENKGGEAQFKEIARAGYSEKPTEYENMLLKEMRYQNLEKYDHMTLDEFMSSRKSAKAIKMPLNILGDEVTLVYDDKTKRYAEFTEEPEL